MWCQENGLLDGCRHYTGLTGVINRFGNAGGTEAILTRACLCLRAVRWNYLPGAIGMLSLQNHQRDTAKYGHGG
jgi:hypothetical protein